MCVRVSTTNFSTKGGARECSSVLVCCRNMSVLCHKPCWGVHSRVTHTHLKSLLFIIDLTSTTIQMCMFTAKKHSTYVKSCLSNPHSPVSFLSLATLSCTHILTQTGVGPAESHLNGVECNCSSRLHNLCLHTTVIRAAQQNRQKQFF